MNYKAILSALLSVLLLSSCAMGLRPSEETEDPAAPETSAAETLVPETPPSYPAASDPEKSETDAAEPVPPETDVPETDPPETDPPETDSPETDPPAEEAPETDPPALPEPSEPETEVKEPEPPVPEKEPETPAEPAPEESGSGETGSGNTGSGETGSFERGRTEGNAWINGAAGLRYILPSDEWRFSDGEELSALNGTLPEGTFCDLQAVSEAGSSVLVTVRGAADKSGETVSLEEYAAVLAEGMAKGGGEDVTVTVLESVTCEFAADTWIKTEFALTYYGEYEGRSVWLTKEVESSGGKWFVTAAATGSPADWMDPDAILSTMTAADAPLPGKPEKPADPADAGAAESAEPEMPARFLWGEDSLEGRVYRNPFAGLTVTAADGWTFAGAAELAEINGFSETAPDAVKREADRKEIRCAMCLTRDGESAEIRLGFVYLGTLAEEWWRYAESLVEDLTAEGGKAGFEMSSDTGKDLELAGAWWFSRTVTYSKNGETVGHRRLFWRPEEGDLIELILDDGVWSGETLDGMSAMIGKAS